MMIPEDYFCFELNWPYSTLARHPRVVYEFARRCGKPDQIWEYDFSPTILQEPAYYQPDEKPGPKKDKQASELLLKLAKRVKC